MDNYIRACICILHDAHNGTKYVSYCGKAETPDAQAIRRKMDIRVRNSSTDILFIPLMFITMLIHRKEAARRKRKINSKTNERWAGSWF